MRRNGYREIDPDHDEHPVDVEVNRRLGEVPDYRELRRTVLELGRELTHQLESDKRDPWIAVEAAMNDRWALATEEHFNAGVEHGMAKRIVDDVLSNADADPCFAPAAAVRALALTQIAARIG